MSLIETKCPLCNGMLWIDPATMEIVDHKPDGSKKPDLGQFLADAKKPKGWDDKLKKAKEEEARRKAEIEAMFKQAKGDRGHDIPAGGMRSAMDWD